MSAQANNTPTMVLHRAAPFRVGRFTVVKEWYAEPALRVTSRDSWSYTDQDTESPPVSPAASASTDQYKFLRSSSTTSDESCMSYCTPNGTQTKPKSKSRMEL
mmetsp:Transcript_45327/g.97179  ORF Transcript_45327/g.97179 Transcript_45327/m.97179 type:complete len:103 (-) Transcript_45327:700-1008(-)